MGVSMHLFRSVFFSCFGATWGEPSHPTMFLMDTFGLSGAVIITVGIHVLQHTAHGQFEREPSAVKSPLSGASADMSPLRWPSGIATCITTICLSTQITAALTTDCCHLFKQCRLWPKPWQQHCKAKKSAASKNMSVDWQSPTVVTWTSQASKMLVNLS